jgi:predicted TPR repeat methyltransferase
VAEIQEHDLLGRVRRLETELEHLRRDLLHRLGPATGPSATALPSLFGKLRGGDVTEDMLEEAKRGLFRNLTDV